MLASLAGTRFIPMTQLTCSRGSSGSCLHLCSQPSTSLPLHQCPVRMAVVHMCGGWGVGRVGAPCSGGEGASTGTLDTCSEMSVLWGPKLMGLEVC